MHMHMYTYKRKEEQEDKYQTSSSLYPREGSSMKGIFLLCYSVLLSVLAVSTDVICTWS